MNTTSRFQNFAQETQLVGQIAAALLLQEEFGTDSLIHPAALRRISEDLTREQRSREWLRGARRFAKERVHVRGLGLLGRRTESSTIAHPDEARTAVAELGIEPRIVFRPIDLSHVAWEALLEIPDLSHLLLRFPRTRDILMGSRCVVAGAAGRPLARGRCLHGTQHITLSRWPRADEVLLRFEKTDPQLEYLLRTECLLRPGPIWLFRIASDGLAYECRSHRVRPGCRYIIVSNGGPIRSSNHTHQINISCEGIYGAILDLPPALTEDWEETLRDLGLGQSKTIEVWPAGLSAIVWDGEGHGEWLASERPCLGIQTDHPLANLLISMGPNDNLALELTSVEPGKPIFVELPNLPVGLHKVHVSTQSSQTGQEEFLGDLDIVMRIRDARPWSPGVSPHGPLIVQMEPSAPTLEQLWEGRIAITFRGPANRNIKCRVSLSEKSDSVLFFKQLPPMRLPVTSDGWRVHFEKHFRTTKEAEKFYDNARICELEFVADELGALKIRCEREFTPLRWSLRRRGQDYFIRLLDDSGSDVQPEVKHLPFETPCIEKMLEYAPELAVPESGGLYFACIPAFSTAIIVPPQIRELADLGCFPRIDRGTHSTESISHALEVSRIWGQARLPGDLISATRQRDVLRALARHIAQLLGGDTWGRAETAAYKRGEDLAILKSAISKRREEIAIGIVLMRDCGNLADETCDKKVKRIASLAMNFHILRPSMHLREYDEEWISELALRLASDPAGVEAWARDILVVGLVRLMEVPTLARAARFLVLATDHHLNSKVAPGELYAGWRWT